MPVISPSNLTKLMSLIDRAYQSLMSAHGGLDTPGSYAYRINQAKCLIRGGSDVTVGAIPASAKESYDLPTLTRSSSFVISIPTSVFKYSGLDYLVKATSLDLSASYGGAAGYVRGRDQWMPVYDVLSSNYSPSVSINYLLCGSAEILYYSTHSKKFYISPQKIEYYPGYVVDLNSPEAYHPYPDVWRAQGAYTPLFRAQVFATNPPEFMPTASFYDNSYGKPPDEDQLVRSVFGAVDDLENSALSENYKNQFKPVFDALRKHVESKGSISFTTYLKDNTACSFSDKMRELYTSIYGSDLPIIYTNLMSNFDSLEDRPVSKTKAHVELKINSGEFAAGTISTWLIKGRAKTIGVCDYFDQYSLTMATTSAYTLALFDNVSYWPDNGYLVWKDSPAEIVYATYIKLNPTSISVKTLKNGAYFPVLKPVFSIERSDRYFSNNVGVGSIINLSASPDYIGVFSYYGEGNEFVDPAPLSNVTYVIRSG